MELMEIFGTEIVENSATKFLVRNSTGVLNNILLIIFGAWFILDFTAVTTTQGIPIMAIIGAIFILLGIINIAFKTRRKCVLFDKMMDKMVLSAEPLVRSPFSPQYGRSTYEAKISDIAAVTLHESQVMIRMKYGSTEHTSVQPAIKLKDGTVLPIGVLPGYTKGFRPIVNLLIDILSGKGEEGSRTKEWCNRLAAFLGVPFIGP